MIATEALHHLTGPARPATAGSVWTMHLRSLEAEHTPVPRRAGCPACG